MTLQLLLVSMIEEMQNIDNISMPDWLVHLVALLLMSLIANYVRMLVKSVEKQLETHTHEISKLDKLLNWASDSIITLAAKLNIELPRK